MPLPKPASLLDLPPPRWPRLSYQQPTQAGDSVSVRERSRRLGWRRNAESGPGPVISYMGWHGRGNIGDDAIYDAVRSQMPGTVFLDLPHHPHERLYAAATGLNWWLRRSSLVVGGGTVAGRLYFRQLINRGIDLIGDNDCFAIGIGVEDPVFQGFRSGSENDELRRWLPLLRRFHTVSVRGPRSAELLADIGLDVQVSGDPALLLPRPTAAPQDGVIGVNLGFGDDLWGHNPDALVDEISAAMRQLSAQGYRLVGVLMNHDDQIWTERALDGLAAEIVKPVDAAAAAAEFARCSVTIVSRLHAGILAALSGTPVIALEYQPKCRDFALSIGAERFLLRTDSLRAADVVERVDAAVAEAPAVRAKTRDAVDTFRQRLSSDYGRVRAQLGPGEN
jgi:hypothetical protein